MIKDSNNLVFSTAPNTIPVMVDYNISQITPHIFVTAENTVKQFTQIFAYGIACVINLANELPYIIFPPQSGIESVKFPIEDVPTFPASQYFDIVADRIAANVARNQRTLLYCHHGRSRSITFILAYLIKYHRLPLLTAYSIVKERRQLALPNVGFWSQLKLYELNQRNPLENQAQGVNNPHDSLGYGERVLEKISSGVVRVLSQVPFLNSFVNSKQLVTHSNNVRASYGDVQQKLSIYSYPYNIRLSSGANFEIYF